MENIKNKNEDIRVLVTGTRGKSSLVRLICAGASSIGARAYGRVTGVVPREIGARGERRIVRTSPAHVEEMRWWLSTIPSDADVIVMENSAVDPELQSLAARWLAPTLVVWTNSRADHAEAWGDRPGAPARALVRGVPTHVPLAIGGEASEDEHTRRAIAGRDGEVFISQRREDHIDDNIALALLALRVAFGDTFDEARAERAMRDLEPDIGDFRVIRGDGYFLANAFSANDAASTEQLFAATKWRAEETRLLICVRGDRPERRAMFDAFARSRPWLETRTIDDGADVRELSEWMSSPLDGEISPARIFGCGNIKGAPLELVQSLLRGGAEWSIPRSR